MSTFLVTGQLLQWANIMGVNPDLEISPSYIGFQDGDVKEYGYFLLFIVNLLHCADAICDPKTADFHAFLPREERKRMIEMEDEEEANKNYSNTESDEPIEGCLM
jgi:hypothetical protein